MKEKKFLEALNDIDDELIEDAAPQEQKSNSKASYKWLAVAASLILAIGIGTTAYHFHITSSKKDIYEGNGITEKSTAEKNNESVIYETTETATKEFIENATEIFTIDKDTWKNKSIEKRYNIVSYNNAVYYNIKKINKSDTDKKIRITTAIGYDDFSGEKHTTEVTIYEIKNISPECAVAVKFKEDENYFACLTRDTNFETLGELIEKYNFEKNIKINRGHYKVKDIAVIEYSNLNKSILTDLLNKNKTLKPVEEPTDIVLLDDLSFNIEINPISGKYGYYIGISEKGYLSINIYNIQHLYYIGEENAKSFIDSFTKNHKGKKLVTTTEQIEIYNGAKEIETEIATEVISNGCKP